ncbi:hypothetical protein GDO81_003380 [Engystomops pustulosus]|uniref:Uncharacterized protein n=1 Tax=Engystomops pustulosus TaxID=76066 RepID=A0AAV7A1I0_ENGPU|nr:hypothetical protein GDO81_003380 [Engystomops pustulosus]
MCVNVALYSTNVPYDCEGTLCRSSRLLNCPAGRGGGGLEHTASLKKSQIQKKKVGKRTHGRFTMYRQIFLDRTAALIKGQVTVFTCQLYHVLNQGMCETSTL